MRVRGSVEYNGTIIEITEKNLTQVYFQHGKDTQIMVTLLIDDEELTFDKMSIHELKLAQISDPITKKLDIVEAKIKGAISNT